MPLTLNVGVSRKLGLPNFGSVGATCAAQVELEPLTFHEPATLQQKIQAAFDVCRRAVQDELAKFAPDEVPPPETTGPDAAERANELPAKSNGSTAPLATQRQIDFLYHLARQIRALGSQRLQLLVEQRFGKPLEELSAPDASRLIEWLKEVRAGTRGIQEFVSEIAAERAPASHAQGPAPPP